MKTVALTMLAFVSAGQALGNDIWAAYAAELKADAAARTSFLGDEETYRPEVYGYIQARYNLNYSDGFASGKEVVNGFELSRTYLGVTGRVHERLGYEVNGDFASDGGEFSVQDAYAWFQAAEGLRVRVGQFKLPYSREELVSNVGQLLVDRSVTHGFFTLGRSQGIEAALERGKLRLFAAFSDGLKTQNLTYDDAGEADWALTGRAEYVFFGSARQFSDFTGFRGQERAMMLGGAVHYESGGDTLNTADETRLGVTADFSAEWSGANFFAAFDYQKFDDATTTLDEYGFVVQGGFFVTDTLELVARYDAVFADESGSEPDDFHTVSAGINYYLLPSSQAAKLSIDVQYFFDSDQTSPVFPSTQYGLITSSEEQFNVRAQMQIAF